MKIDISTNHFTFRSIRKIQEVCAPLINNLKITSFYFRRKYTNKTTFNLGNNGEWLEHFFTQHLYLQEDFDGNIIKYSSGCFVWPDLNIYQGKDLHIYQRAKDLFDISHGLTLIHKTKDYCDFYFFGTSAKNAFAINIYLNNIHLLERFIFFFKEQCHELLNQAQQQSSRILLQQADGEQNDNNEFTIDFDNQIIKNFIHDTKIKKYYLNHENGIISISAREKDIIMALLKGKTTTETADKLFISKRTVENHIENIKNKLRCDHKFEMLLMLQRLGFRNNNNDI